ncbi:26736_t:CDS:2, partial [Dentiscutata erythropus]
VAIDPLANRDQAFGIFRGCLSGRALDWFDRKILGKNWEVHNILANHGQAGMAALRARTMAQMVTSNSFRNPSIAHDYANVSGNNAVTQRQPNSDDYPRVPDKYMPERPPDGYGVNSEKYIHADIINPTPSTSQIMESLANDLYKKLSDSKSSSKKTPKSRKSKQKNASTSDKSRNKSTVIGRAGSADKSFQKMVLDMFDGIAPIDWIEKLRVKIENSSD